VQETFETLAEASLALDAIKATGLPGWGGAVCDSTPITAAGCT